jgi:hypothetical protein
MAFGSRTAWLRFVMKTVELVIAPFVYPIWIYVAPYEDFPKSTKFR